MAAAERPPQLILAERWARALGMTTGPGQATAPTGAQIPALALQRGAVQLIAIAPPPLAEGGETFLIVRIAMAVPASLRAILSRLGEDSQRQLNDAIQAALLSNPRTAFQFSGDPKSVTSIEVIQLEQVFRLDEQDRSSFNRFADAVQELVVGLNKVGRAYAGFVQGPPAESSSRLGGSTQGMFG